MELLSILIVIFGIVLFIAVLAPGRAPLALGISDICRLGIGLGAFVLPFLFVLWGAGLSIRQRLNLPIVRLVAGIAIILVSTLTLIAMTTDGAVGNRSLLFADAALKSHGGYLGAGIAWVFLSYLGLPIGLVIAIGGVLAGAVITGFSFASLFRRLQDGWQLRRQQEGLERSSQGPYRFEDVDEPEPRQSKRRFGRRRKAGDSGQLIVPTRHMETTSRGNGLSDLGPASAMGVALTPEEEALYGDDFNFATQSGHGGALQSDPEDDSKRGEDVDYEDGLSLAQTRRLRDESQEAPGQQQRSGRAKGAKGADGSLSKGAESGADGGGPGGEKTEKVPMAEELPYELPSSRLLKVSRLKTATKAGESELRSIAAELQETLIQFAVDASVVGWTVGPTVTLFKLALGDGVRVARITSLADDIALALAA
ncbi:MAG: DNA translocase FtsK 4TM domain-containing protein, partial [Coriobacteriales bacterium]|nr:DNA translocase FtsK 4TM domain-containing protein [Coriobacteriales bacterium]